MARKILNLASLKELDMGVVDEAFKVELDRVVADIKDRPTDDHARNVSINFVMKPADPQGDVVSVECEVVAKVPKRVSRPYEMRVQGENLTFEPMSPDDPDQLDIGGEIERRGGKKSA